MTRGGKAGGSELPPDPPSFFGSLAQAAEARALYPEKGGGSRKVPLLGPS